MIATDIFAALWKRKGIIALFVAVAILACQLYFFVVQTNTATVYIKYLEEKAENGVTTNGTKLDPYEITDPYIVIKTLEQLGMEDKNATSISQRINVTPVISSAEQEKYASWIDSFSDYEKTEEEKATPVYYKIEFKSNEGVQFAQAFLSELIHQYRSYYTERYSGFNTVSLIPESVISNSDYFYSVDLLQSQIENVVSYLNNIESGDVDYRSPSTGYSFSDLADAYDLLLKTDIAPVTQYILDTGVSKDISTLTSELQQNAVIAQQESDENREKASTQEETMLLYAEKNKEYVSTVIDVEESDDQVYVDVERDKIYERIFTTYDQLILDYVDYAVKSEDLLIDKDYINANLSKFSSATSDGIAPVEDITEIYDQYVKLMDITEETLDGYNAYKSGRTILQVCGIQITETIPELLYYTVSAIFAVCLGCGVIVVGEIKKSKTKHERAEENSSDGVL